jgi:hypothetical protein
VIGYTNRVAGSDGQAGISRCTYHTPVVSLDYNAEFPRITINGFFVVEIQIIAFFQTVYVIKRRFVGDYTVSSGVPVTSHRGIPVSFAG